MEISSMDLSEYNWLRTVLIVGLCSSGVETLGSDIIEFVNYVIVTRETELRLGGRLNWLLFLFSYGLWH
jgi:type IV secretory pathway ATPase VirB11/archaellum biosynthesis ATPase